MSSRLKDLVPVIADDPPTEGRVVNTPEFDLTQIAKKLALTIPVFAAALVLALRAFGVDKATDPAYVAAALGVTATGVLALGIVSAADILGRAYAEAGRSLADATSTRAAEPATSADVAEQEKERLDAAAQKERDTQDREAERERLRLDRLSDEERQRRDRSATEERQRQDRAADEERERLERVAADERQSKDRASEAARAT